MINLAYSLRSGKPLLDRELNKLGREDSVPRLLDLVCVKEEMVPATTEELATVLAEDPVVLRVAAG